MPGRNDPCPCGSGRKYKQCHGAPRRQAGAAQPPRQPPPAAALQQRADALLRSGRLDEALAAARQLPRGAARHELLSRGLAQRGGNADLKAARQEIEAWAREQPTSPEPLLRGMQLYWQQELYPQALKRARQLRRSHPGHPHAEYYLAVALHLDGQLDAALEHYSLAIEANVGRPLTPVELALEAANQMYETAAGRFPGGAASRETRLVNAEFEYLALADGLQAWLPQRPARLQPDQVTRLGNAAFNLGCRDMAACNRIEQSIKWFETALSINPGHELASLNRAYVFNYSDQRSVEEVVAAHRDSGRLLDRLAAGDVAASGQRFMSRNRDPSRRLRVAYLSSDFRRHSVVFFILPVLQQHDREQVEVVVYANSTRDDEWTGRVRATADRFLPVAGLSDQDLARTMERDGIDLLVDLNGFSKGHRMRMLAGRVAPLQLTWIGYPNTTAMSAMDYRLVDQRTDPPGAEQQVSETLLRLPRCFSVYQPPPDSPEPAKDLPARATGQVTFGSFNSLPKLGQSLISRWGEILRALPEARLVVKNPMLEQPVPRAELLRLLEGEGINKDRIELAGITPSSADHLAWYHKVDLCLDSFPYTGTTTTCDALYMGVPVLTQEGASHVQRVSASQLRLLGLDPLVASDGDDYVARAIALGMDWDRLESLRQGLRNRMLQSPLMDHAGFTRQLEQVFRQLWQDWCGQNNSPSTPGK